MTRKLASSWLQCARVVLGSALPCALAAAATANYNGCTEPPVRTETMNVLVSQYKSQSNVRDEIASVVSERLLKRWDGAGHLQAEMRSLIGKLLESSNSGEEFNDGLSNELEFLCVAFTSATPQSLSAPSIAPASSQATIDNAEAQTQKTLVAQVPLAEKIVAAVREPSKEDTIGTSLEAKVLKAESALAGTDPFYPAVHVDTLLSYHDVIFRCKDDSGRQPALAGCEDNTEQTVNETLCKHAHDKTAKCSRNIFDEIKRRNDVLETQLQEATVLKPDATQTRQLAAYQHIRSRELKDALGAEILRGGGFYGFYAGPSFLLQDGGDWKSGTEIYANFNTEAFDRDHCPWASICRAFFDASFVTPDAFPSEVEDGSTSPIAVFDAKGRLRIRGGYQMHWTEWLGAEAGVGVTSPIADRLTSVRAEPRAHVGLHLQTAYPDLAVGEVFLGYGRDMSWERLVDDDGDLTTTADQRVEQRFDRLLLDGTLLFPRVELGGFSLGVRLSADLPWSGDTQSEIRGSVLLYYPFNKELEKYRPKVKEAASE